MYFVSVRTTNNAGLVSTLTTSDGQYLKLPTAPADANYSLQSNTVCESDSVQFVNSSNNSTSWAWSFPGGNPSTSSLEHPKVLYPASGLYNATLIAYGPGGNDTITQSISVALQNSAIASFEVNDTILFLPNAFLATANNSANADSFYWDFNDGSISTDTDPWNVYNQAGTYNVMLIASNEFCVSDTTYISVTVSENTTSVIENEFSGINVFPNPTHQHWMIYSSVFENVSIQITDVSGRIISEFELNSIYTRIDASKWSNGVYFLKTLEKDKANIIKLIKN
jgi:PKD repeat protein